MLASQLGFATAEGLQLAAGSWADWVSDWASGWASVGVLCLHFTFHISITSTFADFAFVFAVFAYQIKSARVILAFAPTWRATGRYRYGGLGLGLA